MQGIRLYSDFIVSPTLGDNEANFVKLLGDIRKSSNARYVNYSVFDYEHGQDQNQHFLTYPSAWMIKYLSNGYYRHDPLFRADFRQTSVVDWQEHRNGCTEGFFESMANMGVGTQVLSVADHLVDKKHGVLSLSFCEHNIDWEGFKQTNLDAFKHHCQRACASYQKHFIASKRSLYSLTPRECECVYWAAIGKTDEQIAALLGTSKWTVNTQFQNVKLKLGAPNRTSAVAIAVSEGLIEFKRAG